MGCANKPIYTLRFRVSYDSKLKQTNTYSSKNLRDHNLKNTLLSRSKSLTKWPIEPWSSSCGALFVDCWGAWVTVRASLFSNADHCLVRTSTLNCLADTTNRFFHAANFLPHAIFIESPSHAEVWSFRKKSIVVTSLKWFWDNKFAWDAMVGKNYCIM